MRVPAFLSAALLSLALSGAGAPALAQATQDPGATSTTPWRPQPRLLDPSRGSKIVAVVNGDVVTASDIENRARLFALSTNLPMSADVLDRLAAQVKQQLIDERLRLQELQRRGIVVQDREIAQAIAEVEGSNGMPQGTLRRRLAADGVEMRTMIDQLRVQIGWGRLLREAVQRMGEISQAEVTELEAGLRAQTGQEEYRISEIFVPIAEARQAGDAQRFADTIIAQLRNGAPFGVVAAQFSQSQTALRGGDLGWVQGNQLDPEVLRVVRIMPPGAVSNPIRVPGGLSIVTLRAKRTIGNDEAAVATLRQAFFPFESRLNPAAPTEAQRAQLEKARALSASARSCEEIERGNAAAGNARPSDPGEVRVDAIGVPALRQLVMTMPLGRASQPLIAEDGIAVVMVCSRETKNMGIPSQRELRERILGDRLELTSRQLMRDLQRRATIDLRS
jgi:peptidyl-prolyl cis-trans isomerase SurA